MEFCYGKTMLNNMKMQGFLNTTTVYQKLLIPAHNSYFVQLNALEQQEMSL